MCQLFEWFRLNEWIAIWLEGIALVLLFGLDWLEYRSQGRERIRQENERIEQQKQADRQMDIWRKQIHADRVAEMFSALRRFHNFLIRSIHVDKTFGPGRDYSTYGNISLHPEGKIFQEYLDLQEAYYLSYLISDRLAAYMKDRMEDADSLQRVVDPEEFHHRLQKFNQRWDVYNMAAKIRELS